MRPTHSPVDKPDRPNRFTAFVGNVEFRPTLPDLDDCDLACLQQATKIKAPKGFRTKRPRGNPEARGIKTLIRKGKKVHRRRVLRMKDRWIGGKAGIAHQPRIYLALDLDWCWVVNVHLPTFNNAGAQTESLNRLRLFAERHPNKPIAFMGDWNREMHQLKAFADSIGGQIATLGKVDHVVYRDLEHVRTRNIPQPSYAHGWAKVTLKEKS